METLRANSKTEKPDSTKGPVNRSRSPIRWVSTDLPPIESIPRRKNALLRSRGGLKLDPIEPFDVSQVTDQAEAMADPAGRRDPKFPILPRDRIRELEKALEGQRVELATRCIQIADLYNVQQQQASELLNARQAIDQLDKSVSLLKTELARQESEAAEAKQALALADKEKAALRAQLDQLQSNSSGLQQQADDLRTAFDDRDAELVSARESLKAVEAQLADKVAEVKHLSETLKKTEQHRGDVLDQCNGRFEEETGRLKAMLAERDQRCSTFERRHAELAERCKALTETVNVLKDSHESAQAELKSKTEFIQFLECSHKVQYQVADEQQTELSATLEQERAARVAAERALVTMRKEIIVILPKLLARWKH